MNNSINLGKRAAEIAHSWYEKAMNRRRPGSALDLDRFKKYVRREDVHVIGNPKDGFLIGTDVEIPGVFVPTHFAPRTMRGGMRLLQMGTPMVLVVTDDLITTVSKMDGWYKVPFIGTNKLFDGEMVAKGIMVNRQAIIPAFRYGISKGISAIKTWWNLRGITEVPIDDEMSSYFVGEYDDEGNFIRG